MVNIVKTIGDLICITPGRNGAMLVHTPLPLKKASLIMLTTLIDGKSKHIMLADDDIDDRETFVEAVKLIAPHIKVSTETDGVELMKKLSSEDTPVPDVLFLDLNMPRKNGFECLDEIRNIARMKSVPIVIYSTSSNPQFVNETYSKGANFYIVKPQSFREIKRMMQKVLSMRLSSFFPQPPPSEFLLRPD